MNMQQYWLMKSEPTNYSIDDLKKDGECIWDGVRNYQARNFMMKNMKFKDVVLFYHSKITLPGIVGLATVCNGTVVDPTQFDKKSKYYDKRAKAEKPIWHCVKVKFKKKLKRPITLLNIKRNKKLSKMTLTQPFSRLSVQSVKKDEYLELMNMIKEF